jgi:hypothetical protein
MEFLFDVEWVANCGPNIILELFVYDLNATINLHILKIFLEKNKKMYIRHM